MAETSAPKEWKGGELLFAGGTDFAMDDTDRESLFPNLLEPHRIKSLMGIKIAFIAGGTAAVHCIAGDMDGRLYTWGRNEKGQLGHGDLVQRHVPKVVEALAGKFVVSAAGGRHHTVVATREGESYAFGSNQLGQCGMGSIKKQATKGAEDLQTKPVKAVVPGHVTAVAAGVDFTFWISDGKLYAAGNPQYGQLGDGSDHSYNAKDSSIQILYEPQPTPKLVAALADKTVTRIACGQNHSLAVDNAGSCYSWGNGGYGRLGHRVQKDEFAPKKIEEFRGRLSVPQDAVIAAASTASFCTTMPGGQMYCWGKLKVSGDNQMYPIPMADLSGWHVRSMSCGPMTYAIAADTSVIIWGQSTNGELGYGPNGRKSAANPDKNSYLEGFRTQQVACGAGFTLFLVDPELAPKDKTLENFPVWESSAPEAEASGADDGAEAGAAQGGKGRGKGGAGGSKRKAAEPIAAKGRAKKAK